MRNLLNACQKSQVTVGELNMIRSIFGRGDVVRQERNGAYLLLAITNQEIDFLSQLGSELDDLEDEPTELNGDEYDDNMPLHAAE